MKFIKKIKHLVNKRKREELEDSLYLTKSSVEMLERVLEMHERELKVSTDESEIKEIQEDIDRVKKDLHKARALYIDIQQKIFELD